MKKLYLVFTIALFALFSYNAQAQNPCEGCLSPKICLETDPFLIPGCGYVKVLMCFQCAATHPAISADILQIKTVGTWNGCDLNSDYIWDEIYKHITSHAIQYCGSQPCDLPPYFQLITITRFECMEYRCIRTGPNPEDYDLDLVKDTWDCGTTRHVCQYRVCYRQGAGTESELVDYYVEDAGASCTKIEVGPGTEYPFTRAWAFCQKVFDLCPNMIW